MDSQDRIVDAISKSGADIIERLDLILAKLDRQPMPIENQLWTLADIAHYLHRHVETVRESMACLPGFPPAIHLPGRGTGRGKALYKAVAVMAWAESYQVRDGRIPK